MKEYIEKNQPIFYNLIKNEFSQQRIPHAFLLIGNNTNIPLTYLAMSLICDETLACENCNDCRKVKENKYAIGYASYGMLGQNKGQIVAFKVNGVAPTDETITDGSYMIQRPLLIVGKGNMGGVADAFTKYLKSEEGRKVIHKMGFVPVK